jgi:hypothetical protein
MFVIVSIYHPRPGEEDAVIALHEHWGRTIRTGADLAGELLRGDGDEPVFVAITRFPTAEDARVLAGDPAHDAFLHRLSTLSASPPTHLSCHLEWRTR